MTSGENAAYDPIEFGTGALLSGAGLASRAPAMAERLATGVAKPQIGDALVRPYLERPAAALLRDAGAGAGAGVGHDMAQNLPEGTPFRSVADLLATMAGGVGGAGLADVARGLTTSFPKSVVAKLTADPHLPLNPGTGAAFSNAESNLAARVLQGSASDTTSALDNITRNAADLNAAGVPAAAVPTAGLLSQDPGLVSLEGAFRNEKLKANEGTPFVNRDLGVRGEASQRVGSLRDPGADQGAVRNAAEDAQAARMAPVDAAAEAAKARAAGVDQTRQAEGAQLAVQGGADNAAKASQALDSAVVDKTYLPDRAAKNEAFRTEGAGTSVDMTGVAAQAAAVRQKVAALPPSMQSKAMDLGLLGDLEKGDAMPYETASQVRIHLSEEIGAARGAGNFTLADNLKSIRKSLSDALDQNAPVATANYRQNFAPKYRAGPGDPMQDLTRSIDRNPSRTDTPPSETAGRFLTSPEKAASLQRVLAASPSAEEGSRAVRGYLLNDYASSVLNPDGTINARRAQAWTQNNSDVLAKFPALRDEFAGFVGKARNGEAASAAAKTELTAALKNSKTTADQIDRSAIGTLLRDDPRDVASGLLSGKWDAGAKLDEINNTIGADATARRGWKAAFADELYRRTTSTRVAGDNYEASLARLSSAFKENAGLLSKVFTPDEMYTLRQGHKLLEYFKEAEKRSPGGSDAAERLLGMTNADRVATGRFGKSVELMLKHVYGNLQGGGHMRRFRLAVALMPTEQQATRDLARMAWFNPDLMAYLLGKPVKNLSAIPTNHGLRAMIAGSAVGRDAATQPNANTTAAQ